MNLTGIKRPVANSNLSFLFNGVRRISWSIDPTLVEFGITSEVGPYFSFHVHGSHGNKVGGQTEDITDEEKHGGVDFPLCVCRDSVNAVMKEWAVSPWRPDGSFYFCLIPCALYKTQLSSFCQRPQCGETGPKTVYAFERKRKENKKERKRKEGRKEGTQIKM